MKRNFVLLSIVIALLLPFDAQASGRNGRYILFSGYRRNTPHHVYKIRLDGTELTRLSRRNGGIDSAWSSDGRRIAFVQNNWADDTRNLVVMRADGSHRRSIGGPASAVAWAPDDSLILFTRSCCVEDPTSSSVFAVRPDGTRLRRVAHKRERRLVTAPQWSPNGRRVSYLETPLRCTLDRCVRDKLFLVNRWGNHRERLLRRHGLAEYDWAPDGSRIVFSCTCGRDQDDLYIVDVQTAEVTRITDTPGFESDPEWSPNGDRIVVVRWRADGSGGAKLITLDPDGTSESTVVSRVRVWPSPSWSPDGSRIVFLRGGPSEVYVVDADGTNETRVTNDRLDQIGPTWQPR